MADDIDKSLLQRLQALRASSATPERPSPAATPVSVDVIERAKTPTREEALADRLKRLRHRHDDNASAAGPSPAHAGAPPASAAEDKRHVASGAAAIATPLRPADADVVDDETDALFRTDDRTLEELLGDVVDGPPDPAAAREPRDEEVRALLEELSAAIPPDGEEADGPRQARDSDDDSEGERMRGEVDDVVARFQDEAELDAAQGR
ncbi:hypothetical protein CDD83_8924 [Cordyceps sp. RAO-2017]|nr:hypothetical protein CDD83_8924 [Cordyceps sp. RAO-2017]